MLVFAHSFRVLVSITISWVTHRGGIQRVRKLEHNAYHLRHLDSPVGFENQRLSNFLGDGIASRFGQKNDLVAGEM